MKLGDRLKDMDNLTKIEVPLISELAFGVVISQSYFTQV